MEAVAEHAPTPAVLGLTGDTQGLTTELLTTMSLCTPQDAVAVETFFELLNVEPEAVMVIRKLFLSSPSKEDDGHTAAAARILCGLLVPNWDFANLWAQLADEVKGQVLSGFAVALQSNPSGIVLKIATVLGAWPSILPCLLRTASSVGHEKVAEQKIVLLILARLPEVDLSDRVASVRDLLIAHLDHSIPELRINAVAAAANVIKNLCSNVDKLKIVSLFPLMAKPLEGCLDNYLAGSAQEALQLLEEVSCATPSILRGHITSVEPAISQIALARCLPVGIRRLAASVLTNVARSAGVVIKAELVMQKGSDMTEFVSRIALLLMDMLIEIDDDMSLPMVQDDESMSRVAQNCLHLLSNAIGGITLMPVAMHWLQSCTRSDWKQSYATLVSITQLAEGCAKVMMKGLDDIIPIISNGLKHTHPAVLWVTLDAIAAIYFNLGLEMSDVNSVLLSLVKFVNNSHDPHLKAHAVRTILHIINTSERAVVEPVITEVLNCLQISSRIAEEASMVVATLASSSAVTSRQSLLSAAHETVVVPLPLVIDHNGRTRSEMGATPPTGNEQQADGPRSKETLIGFLKAFSNGGVTSTTSLAILLGYQVSVKDFSDPWKTVLKSCLFVGITFSLATAGATHSAEHNDGWMEAAATMVLFEGFYTIILGGGLVGLADTSDAVRCIACLLTMGAFAFGWSCCFTHPRVWQRIKGQDNRAPEPHGGWFSKFRKVSSRLSTEMGVITDLGPIIFPA